MRWRTPWFNRSRFGVAVALSAGSRGAYLEIGPHAARVGSGLRLGDPKATTIRPGFMRCRRWIGVRLLPQYVESLGTFPVYVTVDLDSLRESDAITNWENGRFSLSDIVWAISLLRQKSRIIGGDLCGAFSPARYASWFQALAGRFDHPRQRSVSDSERHAVNLHALQAIWPSLIGEGLSGENSRNQEVKDSRIRDA